MNTNLYFILLIVLLSQSCISNKFLKNAFDKDNIALKSLKELNGEYFNAPLDKDTSEINDDLRKILLDPFYVYKWKEPRMDYGKIRLKALSEQQLEVSFFGDDDHKETKILKGEIRDGYFIIKRRVKIQGWIPFLFFAYNERRISIGLNKDGELIAIACRSDSASILFFAAGTSSSADSYFKKIEGF